MPPRIYCNMAKPWLQRLAKYSEFDNAFLLIMVSQGMDCSDPFRPGEKYVYRKGSIKPPSLLRPPLEPQK